MAGAERKKRVGWTIGQGTFAEVKFAVDTDTGAAVAMKVLDKAAILNHRMLHQPPESSLHRSQKEKRKPKSSPRKNTN